MDVFVYGTLTAPERVREVLDSFVFVGPARLEGLRVVEGRYPTLAPPAGADPTSEDGSDAGGDTLDADDPQTTPMSGAGTGRPSVGGRLLRTEELAALDRYEGIEDGLYVRVTVPALDPAGDPAGEVAVYVGDPARLDADARWPGEGSFPERVRAGLERYGVVVRREPAR